MKISKLQLIHVFFLKAEIKQQILKNVFGKHKARHNEIHIKKVEIQHFSRKCDITSKFQEDEKLKRKFDKLNFPVRPRWPLDRRAKFLKGSGVKL